MVELKDRQQQKVEGKMHFHSYLITLMAWVLVPCCVPFYLPFCFWTCWAWNKDTVLLYFIQYYTAKYTKAWPLVENACTWLCQTRELTYMIGHVNACIHLWKFATCRLICRGLTVLNLLRDEISWRYLWVGLCQNIALRDSWNHLGNIWMKTEGICQHQSAKLGSKCGSSWN